MSSSSPNEPRPQIAIVTGGSSPIGRAIALECAKHALKVIVGFRTDASAAAMTCRLIVRAGGSAEAVAADLRSESDVKRLIGSAGRVFGKDADVLINNAAVTRPGRLLELSQTDWNEVLATNVCGVGLCAKHFVMRCKSDVAHIVNIASTAGFAPLPRSPHYVAAKGGVIALTKALALELAPRIRVNAIAPGFVAGTRSTAKRVGDQRLREVPMRRLVQPDEIGRAALFLITSDVCITGHTLVIDGGWSLHHEHSLPRAATRARKG